MLEGMFLQHDNLVKHDDLVQAFSLKSKWENAYDFEAANSF
jgi:hypothetical protein